MAGELPGYYYDAEKNRYFPLKGPIPGSSRKRKSSSSSSSAGNGKNSVPQPNQANKLQSSENKTHKLLLSRELCGNITPTSRGKLNFRTECLKKLASQPQIWKYDNTERSIENGLEHVRLTINMPAGPVEADWLVTGAVNGTFCLFEAGNMPEVGNKIDCVPDRVWPPQTRQVAKCVEPPCLGRALGASADLPSDISCIKKMASGTVLFTTLGSGRSGGAVYMLDFSKPLELDYRIASFPIILYQIASFGQTIWTAASNFDGSQAVLGTNRGAYLLDVETGNPSQIFRCKSDVLSAQVVDSGHIICGLRSGAIVTVDARQKPQEYSSCFTVPHASYIFSDLKLPKTMYGSCSIYMPSSVSCLTSLEFNDQYFLASAMNGSIKLYDHRLLQRGGVQTYNGHVNTHTRIQLGVDPTEQILMSGGEDYKLRIWSIKSGEILFENQVMNSIPSVVCWPGHSHKDYWENHSSSSGVWLGSTEGMFYMNWP